MPTSCKNTIAADETAGPLASAEGENPRREHQRSVRHSRDVRRGARELGLSDRLRSRLRGIARVHIASAAGYRYLVWHRRADWRDRNRIWPIWFAATLGAVLGHALSYCSGITTSATSRASGPLSRRSDLLPRGEAFFRRWGAAGIFLGRFFGPLRSAVPLAAGICSMPLLPFQIANVASALVWSTGILAFGLVLRTANAGMSLRRREQNASVVLPKPTCGNPKGAWSPAIVGG